MAKISRRKVLAAGAAAAAGIAGGMLGCSYFKKKPQPNIVFIIMDAVRADRFGMKGPDGRSLTPFLELASSAGTVFTNCVAASSWTLPSVAGLVTSRNPIVTGEFYGESYAAGAATLAETLQAAGYYTCAVVKNPWLPVLTATGEPLPTVVTKGYDKYSTGAVIMQANPLFAQGIGQEKEFVAFPAAEGAVDEAVEILKARGEAEKPFFLYLHFMNTHEPYSPSASEMRLATAPAVEGIPDYMLFKVIRHRAKARGKDALAAEDMPLFRRAEALYNAAVASTDAAIAKLADTLRKMGAYHNTAFVVTADHGEEFGGHGWFGHAVTLYQDVLRVPLVMWGAEAPQYKTVPSTVRGIDVMPGILALAGLDKPLTAEGETFPFEKEAQVPREAVSCTVFPALPKKLDNVSVSLIDKNGRKAILKEGVGTGVVQTSVEIFDTVKDPGERTNVAEANAQTAAAMEERIEEYKSIVRSRGAPEGLTLDEDAIRRLKSLGYMN